MWNAHELKRYTVGSESVLFYCVYNNEDDLETVLLPSRNFHTYITHINLSVSGLKQVSP